jgi:hypothetical protein
MTLTRSTIDSQVSDVRPVAPEKRRVQDVWMLGVPLLIIFVSLYHLAVCWNSPQPALMAAQPHRTIHVVGMGHQVRPSAKESQRDPSPVLGDEAAFDTATPSWPYGVGWR